MPNPTHEYFRAQEQASVHPTYARLLCMLLRAHHVDVDAALAEAGLLWTDLATREQMLNVSSVYRLSQAAMRISQKPWLGIELGLALPLSAHGPLGSAVMACKDLRQALELVARYGTLRNRSMRSELIWHANGVTLRTNEAQPLGNIRNFILDTLFGTSVRLFETVVGQNLPGLRIDLPFAEPPWHSKYQQGSIGSDLHFNATHLAFHFTEAMLALPCLTADRLAFDAACQHLTLRDTEEATITSRVMAMLGPQAMGYPLLTDVAERLHMSPRTVIRRLHQEGHRYQDLLDESRKAQALWQLRHTQASMDSIASTLGFEDTTNFSRTVRRWFGVAPSTLRASKQ